MGCEMVEQLIGGGGFDENSAAIGADEAVADGAVELGEEGVVEAGGVDEAAGLVLKAELRPGDDFAQFLERAETAR